MAFSVIQFSGTQQIQIRNPGDTLTLGDATNPLVVTINNSSIAVTGTVTSNIGTTGGLALDATLTGGTAKSIARGGAKGTTTAADVTSTSVDANTQALHVAITGTPTVTVGNASIAVTGTFFQATQPVSIAAAVTVSQATAANLLATVTQGPAGAAAWKVDGSAVTQPVIGNSTVGAATPAAGLMVGGKDNSGNFRALSLTTSGALKLGGTPDITATGAITANGQTVAITSTGGDSSWNVGLAGTFSAGTTLVFEGSPDGTNWTLLAGRLAGDANTTLFTTVSGGAVPYLYRGNTAGLQQFRVRCTAFQAADNVTVTLILSSGVGGVFLTGSLPTGTNSIGTVTVGNASLAVTGTFFQATQPVSIAAAVTVAQPTAANLLATVTQGPAGAAAWKVDGSAVTQPVSGTITSNIGTTNGLALDATLTGGNQQAQIKSGTKGTSTAALVTSTSVDANTQALHVAITGTPTVTVGNASLAVTGTFFQATQPVSIAAAVTVAQATAANLLATVTQGPAGAAAWKVDGSAVTQPVSGTITSNIGTTNGLALDATLTGGTQKAIARGGAKGTTTAADVTSTAVDANTQGLDVSVKGTVVLGAGAAAIGSASLTGSGFAVPARADGFLSVRVDPTALLVDTFETFNTTDTWNSFGTTAPTASGGSLTLNPGTTALANSYAKSQATFTQGTSAYLQLAMIVQTDAALITGNTRWWGLAAPAGAPTAAVPIANGVVFELRAADGLLYGSVYSNSVVTQSVALTRPTDGAVHRYQILFKTSKVYFNIDNVEVGSIAFPNPAVAALPLGMGSQNGASTVGSAPTLVVSLMGVGDTAKGNSTISDGLFPWRKATVKLASIAPVATDTSLVVALSPNSVVNGPADATATGALGALNAAVQISTQGLSAAGFQLAAGTLVGTIVPEVSFDGGTTWIQTNFDDPVLGNKTSSIVFGSANTATARTIVSVGGAGLARVRVSAFTSGTANITVRASVARDPSLMSGGQPGAAILPPVALQMGGTDGTNFRALSVNTNGRLITSVVDGQKTTYSASATNIAAAATATDIFTITGSATKTVRVTRIVISGVQTTAGIGSILLIKRSTANSAGTSAAMTAIPHDSNNAAATATALSYTVNPTTGTAVGTLRSEKYLVAAPASTSDQTSLVWDFGNRPGQAIVLRGIAQVLAVNLNGVTFTGGSFSCYIEFTEE